MRKHGFFVCGCSLSLSACFLSDFDAAERKERERALPDWLIVEGGSPAIGGESGGGAGRNAISARGGAGGALSGAGRGGAGGKRSATDVGGVTAAAGRGGARAGAAAKGGAGASAAGGGASAAAKGGAGASAAGGGGASAAGGGASAAGGGASAAGGGASAAGGGQDGSAGMGCGDTTSDAAHCGRCDNDCSAAMALASCVDSRCMRACKSGFGDCNMDLAFGATGDGCEIDLSSDLANCGGCGVRCQPATGGVGFCENGQCKVDSIEVGVGSPVAELHGNPTGGEPYEELCGRDEALVGLDVATNGDYIWGFAARCAPVWLTGAADDFYIATGPSHALVLLSNRATPVQMPMTLECPTGMLVSGVTGATGYFLPDNQLLSLKALSLICSRADVNAEIELQPGSIQTAGSLMGNVAQPFSDLCAPGAVVVGFTGRAGDLVDALMTQCAALDISDDVQ